MDPATLTEMARLNIHMPIHCSGRRTRSLAMAAGTNVTQEELSRDDEEDVARAFRSRSHDLGNERNATDHAGGSQPAAAEGGCRAGSSRHIALSESRGGLSQSSREQFTVASSLEVRILRRSEDRSGFGQGALPAHAERRSHLAS